MKNLLILLFCFLSLLTFGQIEIELRTDGIVVPRMESSSVNSPSEGQVIYDTLTAQLMFYNGSQWLTLSGVFERNGTTVRQKGGYDTDDFVFGRKELPPSSAITDTLFFFDKSKGAFRGGWVSQDRWSPDSLGNYSMAYGNNAYASGYSSIALGNGAKAKGPSSIALGNGAQANGVLSYALGDFAVANGSLGATAFGRATRAIGAYGSTAMGAFTVANGDYGATAMGAFTVANGDNGTVVGRYNDPLVAAGMDITETSPLFIVGNGDSGSGNESNALVVRKNGEVSFENYTFPIADGTVSQVLSTDGSGQLIWASQSSGNSAFEKVGNVVRQVTGVDSDDFIFGRSALPSTGNIIDKFIFFDQLTSSFRGGNLNNSEAWNFRGLSSFGYGENVSPSGDRSTAFGLNTLAVGENAFAIGEETNAQAINSFTIGRFNVGGGNSTLWVTGDPLFEIGIGTNDANRVNAVTVNKLGDFHINHSNNAGNGGLRLSNTASDTESWRIYLSSSTGDLRFYSENNAGATAWIDDATGAYSNISDGRMKKQTQVIGNILPSLLGLKVKSYLYNSQEISEQRSIGFIAQEVVEIFPELVSHNQEEDLYGINYAGFSVVAIKAIQEQQKMIDSVLKENKKLKEEIEKIKAYLNM